MTLTKYIYCLQSELNILYGVQKKSAPSSTLSGIEVGAEIFPYLNFSPVEARDLLCSAQHNIDLLSRLSLSNFTWFLDLLYLRHFHRKFVSYFSI